MKRIFAFALCLMLACTMLPGLTLAEEERYTYTMVMNNSGPLDDDPVMVKYWEDKYGVNFEMIYVENSNAAEQINLLVSANEVPDVMQYIDMQAYYEQGIIGGWTEEFYREHAPHLSAYIDEVNPAAWNYAKFDGELMYAIPGFRMYNSITSPFIWRTDWLENVGITEIPRTLEETETALYAFANNDPDGNGVKDTYGLSKEGLAGIYGAFGFQREMWLPDENGNLVYGDVMPEAKEALALLNKWYTDGVLDPEFITGENQGGYWAIPHAFLNNRIGVTGIGSFYHWVDCTEFEGGTMLGRIAEAWKDAGQTGTYAPGYPPVGPEGKSGTKLSNTTTLRTAFSAELVADTERFARLLEIIDDMCGTGIENSAMAARGLPGETFEIVEWNGVPSLTILVDDYANVMNAMGAWNWFSFIEECGNYEYQKVAYAQDFYWYEQKMADKNQGYCSAIYGALPSQTMYESECKKILDEGYVAIITGDKPIDYFDEMVAAWENAGGSILTQEANELYQQQQMN